MRIEDKIQAELYKSAKKGVDAYKIFIDRKTYNDWIHESGLEAVKKTEDEFTVVVMPFGSRMIGVM